MAQDHEVVLTRNPVLGRLDGATLELDDLPAPRTHEVVVVLVFDLVPGDSVVEVMLLGQARIAQELHGPVDRRVSDVRVLGTHGLIELVTRDVPLRIEEDLEDQISLLRALEVVLFEILGERLVLDLVRHGGNVPPARDPTTPGPAAGEQRLLVPEQLLANARNRVVSILLEDA